VRRRSRGTRGGYDGPEGGSRVATPLHPAFPQVSALSKTRSGLGAGYTALVEPAIPLPDGAGAPAEPLLAALRAARVSDPGLDAPGAHRPAAARSGSPRLRITRAPVGHVAGPGRRAERAAGGWAGMGRRRDPAGARPRDARRLFDRALTRGNAGVRGVTTLDPLRGSSYPPRVLRDRRRTAVLFGDAFLRRASETAIL